MGQRTYRTLPDELTEYAEVMVAHLRSKGYVVRIEKHELGFPYTPSLSCKRGPSRMVLEISFRVDEQRMQAWISYCRSAGSDTRFAYCIPLGKPISNRVQKKLRTGKVGLYQVSTEQATELLGAGDLALQVELPSLRYVARDVQKLLGSAYEDFERSQWREGFEAACQVLENECRKYLRKWSRTGRIRLARRAGLAAETLTNKQINKMTLGQLAKAFSRIETPNNDDKVLGKSLRQINKDRVGVAHKRAHLRTEKSLRQNVGRHMWVIRAALMQIYK